MTAGGNLRAGDRSGSTESSATPRSPSRLKQLERKEGQLWRYALIVLIALAASLALLSWETIRNLPERLEALPVGLVILVILFGTYVWFK